MVLLLLVTENIIVILSVKHCTLLPNEELIKTPLMPKK